MLHSDKDAWYFVEYGISMSGLATCALRLGSDINSRELLLRAHS